MCKAFFLKICLNFSLDGVTLVPELRKPFGENVEGFLVQSGRDNWTRLELFFRADQRSGALCTRVDISCLTDLILDKVLLNRSIMEK